MSEVDTLGFTEPCLAQVGAATAWWVGWFNNRRLYGPLGDIPRAEYERARLEGQPP